ncbi:MAG: hypothetical protein QOJ34_2958 [Pseudonocardiales bacterium]|jgi:hypothetical protein|nr:hypothetical protein [Pseudonocardiales bacterium]
MPDETEESTEPRTPGAVPSEGRTIARPVPTPAAQFSEYIRQHLNRA